MAKAGGRTEGPWSVKTFVDARARGENTDVHSRVEARKRGRQDGARPQSSRAREAEEEEEKMDGGG
jgi:hypothetical protein